APYLPSRPAWASASSIRYFALNCPNPPRRHAASWNAVVPSNRAVAADSTTGTGCHEWLRSLLGVLWSPVTISTSGVSARTAGIEPAAPSARGARRGAAEAAPRPAVGRGSAAAGLHGRGHEAVRESGRGVRGGVPAVGGAGSDTDPQATGVVDGVAKVIAAEH